MGYSIEQKKLSIVRILQVLEKYSDAKHKLTQDEIANLVERDYGMVIDRKTVGRNIQTLKDLFDQEGMLNNVTSIVITTQGKGTYLEKRLFEESELRLIIDSILASKHISSNYSKDLINKILTLGNKYFEANIKYIASVNDWDKTDNKELFNTIDVITNAIKQKKKIEYDYHKYRADKKLHKTSTHKDSPYQLVIHNQRYYLMSSSDKYENVGYLRVDKIKNVKIIDEPAVPLDSFKGYSRTPDYKKISSSLPYMFAGDFETVRFVADIRVVDDVIDYFGSNAKIKKISEEKIEVAVYVSPKAMEYWALQYMNYIEIQSPITLRENVKEDIKKALEKYNA